MDRFLKQMTMLEMIAFFQLVIGPIFIGTFLALGSVPYGNIVLTVVSGVVYLFLRTRRLRERSVNR